MRKMEEGECRNKDEDEDNEDLFLFSRVWVSDS